MATEGTRQRWTYAEFARLPSEGSTRYEVIGGELAVTPAPTLWHQKIVLKLGARLLGHAEEHGLGDVFVAPVDVLFAEGDYMEPDIVFVRKAHGDRMTDRGVEGPPDLIVEVLSPSTAARDRGVKLDRYRHFAVPEYWVVDPDEGTIEVWDLEGGAVEPVVYTEGEVLRWAASGEAPSLELDPGELFRR